MKTGYDLGCCFLVAPVSCMRYGAEVELIRQLRSLVSTLAGAGDRLNITALAGAHKI